MPEQSVSANWSGASALGLVTARGRATTTPSAATLNLRATTLSATALDPGTATTSVALDLD